jgi:hypothetical protein
MENDDAYFESLHDDGQYPDDEKEPYPYDRDDGNWSDDPDMGDQ